jgi:CRISPR/Cas system-associated exonuclease Cas4 (RecB family)
MQTVTQSFIKNLFDYKMGDTCGLQFEASYVKNIEFPSSAAMNLGSWFEYMCTGQTTKFGHIPQPVRLKPKKLTKKELESGLKQEDQKGDLSKKYSDALIQVDRFNRMIQENEIEIVDTGVRLVDNDLGIQGDIDILARKKGSDKFIFIDTKFSGLLDNKWDDLGWADESLEYKDKLMIQAVHYKLLGLSNYGYVPDFYFWVFSSVNTSDAKNIKVEINEDRFTEHKNIIREARNKFNEYASQGWIPRPKPKRCKECPLFQDCEYKSETPIEQIVYY